MNGQLVLPEGAEPWLEILLARQNCGTHIGTTLAADGRCDMCELVATPHKSRRARARAAELAAPLES